MNEQIPNTAIMEPTASLTEPAKEMESVDPLKEIKAKLTETEKENFFKAWVADKPYISEEFLFNGKIPVKFSTLNIKQNNLLSLQMQFDRDKGIAKNTDAYILKIIQYRIAASLLELDRKPFGPDITAEAYPPDEKSGTTHLLKKLELMEDWGICKVSGMTEAFNRFEKKIRALTEESSKENF